MRFSQVQLPSDITSIVFMGWWSEKNIIRRDWIKLLSIHFHCVLGDILAFYSCQLFGILKFQHQLKSRQNSAVWVPLASPEEFYLTFQSYLPLYVLKFYYNKIDIHTFLSISWGTIHTCLCGFYHAILLARYKFSIFFLSSPFLIKEKLSNITQAISIFGELISSFIYTQNRSYGCLTLSTCYMCTEHVVFYVDHAFCFVKCTYSVFFSTLILREGSMSLKMCGHRA